MRRVAILALLLLGACGVDSPDDKAAKAQTSDAKCNKACQRSNDAYIKIGDYSDYFVYDSDGSKDMVFAVYHNVSFPTAGEGVKCDVLKSFDNEGVGISVVCPDGKVFNGTASQSNNDEGE